MNVVPLLKAVLPTISTSSVVIIIICDVELNDFVADTVRVPVPVLIVVVEAFVVTLVDIPTPIACTTMPLLNDDAVDRKFTNLVAFVAIRVTVATASLLPSVIPSIVMSPVSELPTVIPAVAELILPNSPSVICIFLAVAPRPKVWSILAP